MAGAFSGHLLASYDTQRSTPGPRFGQPQSSYSSIVTSGAMSFDASMHGSSGFRPSNSVSGHSFSTDLTDDTAIKIATLQAKLNKKLGPEYISQRPGPGGGPKLTYAEGWKIINLANEVFGFNGWSSSIVNMTIDYMDCNEEGKRYNVGVSCIVRVTLSCGVYHEDVGYGAAENVKSKAQAIDKSRKESVTDAVKRALRNFGTLLGNCLYDKSYTQEITKIKVQPNSAKAKFDKSELYRHPEFDDTKPNIVSTSESTPASVPTAPRTTTIAQGVKTSPVLVKCEAAQEAETPITYIPRHLRQAMAASTAGATPTTPSHNEQALKNAHRTTNGLNTPILTPVQQTVNPNRGQYRRAEPSPLAQPEQRRVSFTGPAAAQVDEVEIPAADESSYSIDSDDDAFYANVDLGDGDLGRPIDFEEGLGGVSVSDVSLDRGEAATSGNIREPPKAPQESLASSSSGRGEAASSGGSRFPLAHPPRPQAQAGPSTTSRALHGVDNATGVPAAPPMKHKLGSSSSVSISSSSEVRRAAPSIGGFHFPPAMNPAAQQLKPVLPPQRSTGATSSSSNSSGLKRKADTMEASRQPLQGLGLVQQHPGSGNPNRAPLTSLDIGTGSDVKRTKR